MSEYFDRHGKQISSEKLSELWKQPSYKRVGYTSSDGIDVSTVWLGIDHSFTPGPPIIFETLVFGGQYDQDGERYCTEQEAIEGHERWVRKAITERGC